jgi:hypothetical protein
VIRVRRQDRPAVAREPQDLAHEVVGTLSESSEVAGVLARTGCMFRKVA